MTDNTPTPEKNAQNQEWSFSFEALGEGIASLLNQLGIGADADLQHTDFVEPLGDAPRAKIHLELTVGHVTLEALPPDSPNLIEASVTSIGAVEMLVSMDGEAKSVRLRQKRTNTEDPFKPVKDAVDTAAHNTELKWHIRLTPNLPLTLEVNTALTLNQLDLSALNITRLKMDGGTGETSITLPTVPVAAYIDSGVGILTLTVPPQAKTTLELNIGAGATALHIGEAATIKAEIEGGVGNCDIYIPQDAALRLRADSGLGNIDVPERLESVSFESEFISESGTWQTADYEHADHKLDIQYEGGVGSLIIHEEG